MTEKIPDDGNAKYIWRTLKIPLINCEIQFILTWSVN